MDTPDQQPQEKEPKEERTRYVDELRRREDYPPGDGWISITDAARITRTSEAMARRWVTSGRLAVKKEAVGISKHTRLVRISDVAEIRPIVDPTAAITGDVQKLDLPSIPRQQQQIMADHERLLQENAHLTGIVEQFTARLQEALDQQALRLTTLDETHSRTLQALKIALAEMNADLERVRQEVTDATEQRAAELRREITDEQRERQQDTQVLTTRLQTQDQESQARLQQATTQLLANQQAQDQKLEAISTSVAQTQGTIEQVQRDLQAAIESVYQKATKEATTLLEQQAALLQTQLENLERDQARDVATFTTQLESITIRLEQMNTAINTVKTTTESNQQRAIAQEKRLDTLQQELEQEREARRVLTQQLQQGQKATKGRRTEPTE